MFFFARQSCYKVGGYGYFNQTWYLIVFLCKNKTLLLLDEDGESMLWPDKAKADRLAKVINDEADFDDVVSAFTETFNLEAKTEFDFVNKRYAAVFRKS